MFVHIVLFWLKADTPEPVRVQAPLDAVAWLKEIPGVQHVFAGKPAMTPRAIVDNSYDLGLCVVFQTVADHDAYQVHPLHKKFIAQYNPYWSKVQAFDFQ
jgi:hypothetical protein